MSVRVMLLAASLAVSLNLAAETTTQSRLAKYGSDLAAVWTEYPREHDDNVHKDETVRKQKLNDLNTALSAEISKLEPPDKTTVQKAIDNYTSNLQRAKTLFRLEKMSNERGQFITACTTVFRRELPFTTDLGNERTASKCFDMLADWCDSSRNALHTAPDEAHVPFYTAMNEVFTQMLKKATKDAGDPTSIYDRQLTDIKKRFPVTSPIFEKTNQPIVTLLESAAKLANSFNKRG